MGGDLADAESPKITREQLQLLLSIGFDVSDKRKQYDRSVIDKKWEEKL